MSKKISKYKTINLQEELTNYLRRGRMKKYKLPEIGVYYPTTLVQNCIRGQWNFYKMTIQQRKFPDGFILKTAEGNAWHEMLEDLKIWDSVEGSCSMKVPLEDGTHITIRGRYDVVRGDTVYDFKRTEWVPYRKAKFPHLLQLNFYMECLGKPKGVIAYIGYSGGEFRIMEYYHVLTDWMTETLKNRALTLHTHLVHDVPPVCTCRRKTHEIEWEQYVRENGL
jgi:hypothetical protein